MNVYGAWRRGSPGAGDRHRARPRVLCRGGAPASPALRLAARAGAMFVAVSRDIQHFLPPRSASATCGSSRTASTSSGRRAATATRGRQAIGVGPGERVIGTIGNLYPGEGPSGAPRSRRPALPGRARRDRRSRRGERRELRQLAGELGIGDRLHLLGYRTDTPDLLAAFDIYALPSFSEGQSLALMEAMAAGLPIAATRVGGNPEVLGQDGETGIFVPPGEPEALATALDRLLRDAGDRPSHGRVGARARAERALARRHARALPRAL